MRTMLRIFVTILSNWVCNTCSEVNTHDGAVCSNCGRF